MHAIILISDRTSIDVALLTMLKKNFPECRIRIVKRPDLTVPASESTGLRRASGSRHWKDRR